MSYDFSGSILYESIETEFSLLISSPDATNASFLLTIFITYFSNYLILITVCQITHTALCFTHDGFPWYFTTFPPSWYFWITGIPYYISNLFQMVLYIFMIKIFSLCTYKHLVFSFSAHHNRTYSYFSYCFSILFYYIISLCDILQNCNEYHSCFGSFWILFQPVYLGISGNMFPGPFLFPCILRFSCILCW